MIQVGKTAATEVLLLNLSFTNSMHQPSLVYTPGDNLTIDEMLIEFHGRVVFRQYIPTKPGKFGVKVFWVTEAETAIPLKYILYKGQGTVTEAEKVEHGGFVKELVIKLTY